MSYFTGYAITGGANNSSKVEVYRDDRDTEAPFLIKVKSGPQEAAILLSDHEVTVLISLLRMLN